MGIDERKQETKNYLWKRIFKTAGFCWIIIFFIFLVISILLNLYVFKNTINLFGLPLATAFVGAILYFLNKWDKINSNVSINKNSNITSREWKMFSNDNNNLKYKKYIFNEYGAKEFIIDIDLIENGSYNLIKITNKSELSDLKLFIYNKSQKKKYCPNIIVASNQFCYIFISTDKSATIEYFYIEKYSKKEKYELL